MSLSLPSIPTIDVRAGGVVRHAAERAGRARDLRDACLGWFPFFARPLVPAADAMARRWLRRSASPYVDEIGAVAQVLGFPGVWLLNGSYQWACTAQARVEEGVPWLARTLDWPFSGLGRLVEVARMAGPAGDYLSATWPGYVGVLTAVAPGRFGAAINQGPMFRRSRTRLLRPYDVAANAVATLARVTAMPPDQLLRQAFEQARDYDEARHMLESVPVARPVIYTLVGCRPDERCVIERTERGHRTRNDAYGSANDWLEPQPQWEARIGAKRLLTCSFDEAAERSLARREGLESWRGAFADGSFGWVAPPVLNAYTRLAVELCPARGVLRVAGYELADGAELAAPVTQVLTIEAAAA